MAPRREDSQSVLSYRSNGSGGIQQLSISDDEISLLSGQSVGLYIEEDAFDPTSDPEATDAAATTTTTTSLVDEQRQTSNHEGDDHWEGALTRMLIPNHLPSTEEKNIVAPAITRDDAAASSSSELSLGHKSNSSSASSIMTSSSCFDGLIVGFRDRRASASATDHAADDDASEDDLIVGFVDRRAIANSDSRVK